MTDSPSKVHAELQVPDALAAALQPAVPDEEPARPGDGPDRGSVPTRADEGGPAGSAEATTVGARDNRLALTKSVATDASATTGAVSAAAARYASRPWYKRMNPLRWGGVPMVPDERPVSREYRASFLSKLTFQWMTPLMTVSLAPRAVPCRATLLTIAPLRARRRVISARSSRGTSGPSIRTEPSNP